MLKVNKVLEQKLQFVTVKLVLCFHSYCITSKYFLVQIKVHLFKHIVFHFFLRLDLSFSFSSVRLPASLWLTVFDNVFNLFK